jgi:GNAT superfamily N-acetyltransferase
VQDSQLIELACASVARYLELGNETFQAHGATFVRNRSTPSRRDANHVGLIRCSGSDEIEALLRRTDLEFADYDYRRFGTDPFTPPQVNACLSLDGGYATSDALHLVLEGELQAQPRDADIREVLTEEDWQSYGHLQRLDEIEDDEKHGRTPDLSGLPDRLAYVRAKTPAVRSWLAYVDGQPCAFFSSWPGENGAGQVEDLFTHPDYRHRGLATALIAHCVADARARGAGPVIISAEIEDTPKYMYASMGFRPLFLTGSYLRLVS